MDEALIEQLDAKSPSPGSTPIHFSVHRAFPKPKPNALLLDLVVKTNLNRQTELVKDFIADPADIELAEFGDAIEIRRQTPQII